MATVRFGKVEIDWSGVEEMLMTDPGIRKDTREEAERVAARARASAPPGEDAYRAAVTVVERVTSNMRMNRFACDVSVTGPWAGRVEAQHGTLARALGK